MIQFYSPDIKETKSLIPEEAHHCVKVLRKKENDIIYVTDGQGKRFECRIILADTRKLHLEILREEIIPKGWDYEITIAVAPTKNADRMSWLVEKSTEIGVDKILFINCRNSERRTVNIDRLRRNAISAMNQSLKTRLPEILDIESLDSICNHNAQKFFGYCDKETDRAEFITEYCGGDVIIAIGPEGDFAKEEIKKLLSATYKAVTFGNERLRTETAAIYGVTAVHLINQLKTKN